MDDKQKEELSGLLTILPPVEFCCVYGSSLHPNNQDKSRMIDYILGVSDPLKWHSENLKMNGDHYALWMVYLGGAKLITEVADEIGVGVHFNPFVSWNSKTVKYGVVRMHDLTQDVLNWETFYLSGRLQKPVHVLVDSLDIEHINSYNLRAATSTALLLLPSNFTEEDLYAKICSLSYMGDLRMLFAEDRNKDYSLLPAQFLISCLPKTVRSEMGTRLGKQDRIQSGRVVHEVVVKSRDGAANCIQKIVRRKVMVSSVRQAVSGLLTAGAATASRYLAQKMHKAWQSWT